MQVLLYILEILKRLLGVKMENVITLPFIDQLAKLKKKKRKKIIILSHQLKEVYVGFA